MSDSNFDDLLNDVLRRDAQIEPLAGLDERVMRRVMAPPPRRSTRKLFFWWLAVGSFLFLMVALLVNDRSAPSRAIQIATKSPTNRPSLVAAPPTEPDKPVVARARAVVAKTSMKAPKLADLQQNGTEGEVLPKLGVFPTPTEVSEPIRELAALSTRPRSAVLLLTASDAPRRPPSELKIEPLTIAAIEIKPLFPLPDQEQNKGQETKEKR